MRPSKDFQALFVTQFFPGVTSDKNTGGTISNRHLLRFLGSRYSLGVLSFDLDRFNDTDFREEPYSIFHRAHPPWRAFALFRYWGPFVREQCERFFAERGRPRVLLATTSTLKAFDCADDRASCVAIVQAFENFGFRCSYVPFRQRINLTKLAAVRRFQDALLMRRADHVLTNSSFMRSAIADRFSIPKAHIHVLPQLCDIEPRFDISPIPSSIGFVHRGADKNVAFVVTLAQRAPDLRFLIYGHTNDLPRQLPPNIEVRGWASNRSEMFASAMLWIVPSLWEEPFGRVSIEAQAAERPVLVAERGGLTETVRDPRFSIQAFDPAGWLHRIRYLLALAPSEVKQNGEDIRASFSQQHHDKVIEATFDEIEGEPRRAKCSKD